MPFFSLQIWVNESFCPVWYKRQQATSNAFVLLFNYWFPFIMPWFCNLFSKRNSWFMYPAKLLCLMFEVRAKHGGNSKALAGGHLSAVDSDSDMILSHNETMHWTDATAVSSLCWAVTPNSTHIHSKYVSTCLQPLRACMCGFACPKGLWGCVEFSFLVLWGKCFISVLTFGIRDCRLVPLVIGALHGVVAVYIWHSNRVWFGLLISKITQVPFSKHHLCWSDRFIPELAGRLLGRGRTDEAERQKSTMPPKCL